MKLSRLDLTNFRCFAQLTLDLHPYLTVLVAENGQGKSSVLDALRIALWPFVGSFDLARGNANDPGNGIAIDDVRLVKMAKGDMARQLPAEVSVTGDFGTGREKTWSRRRISERKSTKTRDASATSFVKQWAGQLQRQVRDPDMPDLDLPVFGYYGTGRLWQEQKLTTKARQADVSDESDFYIRTFAYRNCLNPASSYSHFREWFTWLFKSYREEQIRQLESLNSNQAPIAAAESIHAVQQAIDSFLEPITGWHSLTYSVTHEKALVLEHPQHGILKVDQLSDGIRSVLAMVGDIAYRSVKLNPQLGRKAPQQASGVILIDEVDMHLHPFWQQRILQQLRKAFPRLQFVVTTHSPQVLSSVKQEHVRLLSQDESGQFIAATPVDTPYGRLSSDVLEAVMHVSPYPPVDEREDLRRLTRLVDQGAHDSAEARELMDKLINQLGAAPPAMQKLQRSIRRQQVLKDAAHSQRPE
ncbi:AAA family ATPase [Halomonas alkalicola]|uniref:AAA family ATPase n=1 Tax=Halomonas alkalicola TaxID=1930622 RepID=A0ABY9H4H6_9GAMM|nr:AAA family ATPase [Halomonas alkalicola]WLI73387.1 AAA family ATPase [Halomonas alkalicola]